MTKSCRSNYFLNLYQMLPIVGTHFGRGVKTYKTHLLKDGYFVIMITTIMITKIMIFVFMITKVMITKIIITTMMITKIMITTIMITTIMRTTIMRTTIMTRMIMIRKFMITMMVRRTKSKSINWYFLVGIYSNHRTVLWMIEMMIIDIRDGIKALFWREMLLSSEV